MSHGIYTLHDVYTRTGKLFRPISRHKPGPRLLPLCMVRPNHAAKCTRLVVRVKHRVVRTITAQQANNKVYTRKIYHVSGVSYALTSIDWEADVVTVLAQYADKNEAIAALRAIAKT